MQSCRNTAAWRKVADHNALSRLLARPARDRTDRVCSHRTNTARMWFISAPDPDLEDLSDARVTRPASPLWLWISKG